MEIKLPEIDIAGTTFFFDINEIVLVQKDDPENKIYFNNMWDHGDYYAFHYSPKTKNYHPVKFRPEGYSDGEVEKLGHLLMNNPVEYVEIPRIGKLDPNGMCRKYGCTREDLLIKSDFEIMVNQDIFKSRMEGTPVTIELAGITYEIDLKYNCLRPKDEQVEEIFLDKYHYDSYIEDAGVYHLLYNIQERRAESSWPDGTEGFTILAVPNLFRLDPIGGNLHYGDDPRWGLLYETLQMHHVADTVPWDDYNIEVMDDELLKLRKDLEDKKQDGEPVINIMGDVFIVDVGQYRLYQKGNEGNILSLHDWQEVEGGYGFYYDTALKNIPREKYDLETTHYVEIPEFTKMAPMEVAEKEKITLRKALVMTDFELMVNKYTFENRLNGQLPYLLLEGNKFLVDVQNGLLRPEYRGDAPEIELSAIQKYYQADQECYHIPYNPVTRTMEDLEYRQINDLPKDVVILSFPSERLMDPVGWNIKHGFDPRMGLKTIGLRNTVIAGRLSDLRTEKSFGQTKRTAVTPPKGKKQKRGRGL